MDEKHLSPQAAETLQTPLATPRLPGPQRSPSGFFGQIQRVLSRAEEPEASLSKVSPAPSQKRSRSVSDLVCYFQSGQRSNLTLTDCQSICSIRASCICRCVCL